MNTPETTSVVQEAQKALSTAVAQFVEQTNADLQKELVALRQRVQYLEALTAEQRMYIEKLSAEKVRECYETARKNFDPKEYENFNPEDYTIPAEEILENVRKRLRGS